MYHYVYKTTNLSNGKMYIGKHSTNKLDDDYVGSGIALMRAVRKYGIDSFKKEILMQFSTSDEAFEYEKLLITEEVIKDANYYNMKSGGFGGGIVFTDKVKEKMRMSSAKRFSNCEGTVKGKNAFNNGIKQIFLSPDDKIPEGYVKGFIVKRKYKKGIVVKATTSGTFWINNGSINKLVKPGAEIPDGFIKGRLMKRNKEGQFS